ncbi:CYTH and CHAD domain-containing protein [Streptomyces sp. NPDC001893]|uniref:CYTH and CHAD domain-containing protein n=1 Tax=Streptomyces sp. NPDC001893 TaxID=3154530 RepID=UPI00332DF29E
MEGVTSVADRSLEELDAVYYDTDDLRLSGSSAVLRRRTGGFDAGWHLKLPLPGDSREEVQAALTDAVPDTLRDLALSRTRGAELTPVVRIRSSREVRELVHIEGGVLAELSIDAVRAQSLRAQGRSAAWREEKLREHGIAHAQWSSKLARVLDEMAPVPAGEQVLAYVREQIRVLTALDPAVRRDRPDSVHRMRVACRRLRSCLRLYRSVLDREVTDAIRGDLKWLAGELGAERDQEVLMKRLTRGVKALPKELVLGPVSARLQAWNVARGSESHQRSLDALGSRRYLALLDSLAALGQQPPLRAKAGKAADKVMAKAVLKEFDRLAQRMAPALDLPPGSGLSGAVWSAVAGG